jgi:hypothetical protein
LVRILRFVSVRMVIIVMMILVMMISCETHTHTDTHTLRSREERSTDRQTDKRISRQINRLPASRLPARKQRADSAKQTTLLTDDPGKSGRPFTISAKMHPTLHMSTDVE